jgi:hypothetical protein
VHIHNENLELQQEGGKRDGNDDGNGDASVDDAFTPFILLGHS